MTKSTRERVQKRRQALRMAGLRPIQICVPDTHRPGFVEECHRQSQIAAKADLADAALLNLIDDLLTDTDGWIA